MDEKLSILPDEKEAYTLLNINGRIDGYWSKLLEEYLENSLRSGSYNIALNLKGVHYMSSLGIRILVKYAKLFRNVNGSFGIIEASTAVEDLLKMVGLNTVLRWKSPEFAAPQQNSAITKEVDAYSYEITKLNAPNPVECSLRGNPGKLQKDVYSAEDCQSVEFGKKRFGIGLGAIGLDFGDCKERFGEFVGLGDAVVFAPAGKSNSPDYMLRTGTLIPRIELLYGITFEGDFDTLLYFNSKEPANTLKFSNLLSAVFELTGHEQLVMVMLAETSGLVGVSINRSPAIPRMDSMDLFGYPDVKENINFTSEPEHKNMMTITVGVATLNPEGDVKEFTRQLTPESKIYQHFHSAIFSYHPFRKTNIDLDDTIAQLFENDKIMGVLHLINDNRAITGIGESEFKNGVCWIGKLSTITKPS